MSDKSSFWKLLKTNISV